VGGRIVEEAQIWRGSGGRRLHNYWERREGGGATVKKCFLKFERVLGIWVKEEV